VSANYVDILSERLTGDGIFVVNAGINSELAYNVLMRTDEVIRCDPDYVTILIGTNDAHGALVPKHGKEQVKEMGLPRPPDEGWFRENLTEIARRLKESTHASVALISIPPIGEDPADPAFLMAGHYAGIIKEVAGDEGVAYLPLFETMSDYLTKHPHDAPPYTWRDQQYDMYVGIGRHFLLGSSFDDIARSNGFLLETDYLHLNSAGAGMVAGLIEGFVTKGKGVRP
jgi:lysophospholipase L1-like esterase